MLTPKEIAEEINHSFDILDHEIRDLPPRHQRIEAVFEASWRRLSVDEQRVFMRLSVFRGGFTREAAHAVAGATLPVLNGLVNKSMLQVESGTRRYSIQQLLQQYGQTRLGAASETEATRTAHSHYFMTFMNQRTPDLKGGRQIEAFDEIEVDFDNIRAGWLWAVAQADYDALGQAIEAIVVLNWHFSGTRQSLDLFQLAIDQLPPQPADDPHPVWRRIYIHMCLRQDVLDTTRFDRYLADARQRQDWYEAAFCIGALGRIALLEGDHVRAVQLLHESLDLWLQLNEPYYAAQDLWELRTGYICCTPIDLEAGIHHRQECLRLRQEIGDKIGIAWCVFAEFWELLPIGEYRKAEERLRAGLRLHQEVRNLFGEAYTFAELAFTTFLNGDFPQARKLIEQSLQLYLDANIQEGNIGYAFQVQSLIAFVEGNQDVANQFRKRKAEFEEDIFAGRFDTWVVAVAACALEDYQWAAQLLPLAFSKFRG